MSSRLALPALLAAVLVLPGCVSFEMGRIKRDIERDVEADGTAEVGKGFAMAFGRGTIGSSRFLSRLFAPTATEPYRVLSRHVRQVKVGRYGIAGTYDASALSRPEALTRYEDDGWYPLVTVREPDETVWVLYREDPRDFRLTDLLAVVLTQEEMVLTRVRGDLSSLVVDAVAMGTEGDLFGGALGETGLFGTADDADDGEADLEPPDADVRP